MTEARKERDRQRNKIYRENNKQKVQATTKAWKKANPEKVRLIERRHWLKRTYNITLEDYDALLESQGGHCAICPSTVKLVVDHCHDTGVIRGILCNSCNRGIGLLGDSTETLTSALNYLGKRTKI